ncbi:MAG TPA: amidohydrolase family protein [Thermoanaerobaculia bacterium]|nr:amidohydrolase family protein [Thermoanaerobaculia bacterium]
MRPLIPLLALALAAAAPTPPSNQVTALRFGRLVDGKGAVVTDAVVVIEGERITRVGHGETAIPAGAKVVDLRRYTGIPGLIDAHTHMTFYWDRAPGSRPWSQLEILGAPVTVFLAQENARKTLETGVTTVRDLGSWEYTDLAMRELIQRGAMVGPRMLVAGYGLHVSGAPPRPGVVQPEPGRADGVAEVQRVARQQLAAGADWIKMYGSTGSDQDVTGFETYTYEEMKAAVDVAHQAGKRIAIHSYGPDGARDAVRAGADSVEHATDMDDATLAEMARRGTFYVPTVDHNRYYIAHREEYGYDQAAADRLQAYLDRNLATLRRAVRAKVRIAMGSDAVFTGFGENTQELRWFVKAGMTPAQALAAATANGAALLGMETTLGAVAPGYEADLVAVEGDPLQDVGAVVDGVRWVMKGGQVVVDRTASPGSRP